LAGELVHVGCRVRLDQEIARDEFVVPAVEQSEGAYHHNGELYALRG
jgi:hypothetical protein